MDEISDELLMAFRDGELLPEQRQWVVRYIAEHPEVELRLKAFDVTGRELRTLLPNYADEPIPQRILDVLQVAPASSRKSAEPGRGIFRRWTGYFQSVRDGFHSWQPAVAIAGAGLLVGTAAGWWLHFVPTSVSGVPFATIDRAGLAASDALRGILDTSTSSHSVPLSASSTSGSATIVLTFADKDGQICRQFELHQADGAAMSGVACRQSEQAWRVQLLAQGATGRRPTSRSAPAGMHEAPASVEAFVTARMSGDALGEEDEARLIARNWRRGN